jgi:endoglucanase
MKKNIFWLLLIAIFFGACQPEKERLPGSDSIRLNQLGYYPKSAKQFAIVDTKARSFTLTDQDGEKVFQGLLADNGFWVMSGEKVFMGDFSAFDKTGTYTIIVDDSLESFPFEIKDGLYEEALNAAIKSYYFQRASMPIEEQFGGIYKRAAGHPDSNCQFHPSSGHESGMLYSPGGWYDAGDYGKYTVNAALSVGQMLLLLEQFPDAVGDGELNIPESGNGQSDLWDELKYELDWLLTMQDGDGGVFHKLTAKTFSGFIMPEEFNLERMVIGKGTAATLDFAAVMAQASRFSRSFDPEWSAMTQLAAVKAFNWAIVNDSVPYSNPEDVSTGAYDDDDFSDDFYWAASELYLTTKNPAYLGYVYQNQQPYVHQLTNSWKNFVRNNGFHSLLENSELLDTVYANALKENHLVLADETLALINASPYKVALNVYEWGSNSDILNQAVILCVAHRLTGDEKYLLGAEKINDYIYGKNATGYCYFTGFGDKQVMFPHHWPSGADGIAEPVPGFIVGGPNGDKQDIDAVEYNSVFPAQSYMDVEASYASNEVCINWNAPAVYVMGYLEQVRK